MRSKTLASVLVLGLSGAALAQITTPNDPKLANAAGANATGNALTPGNDGAATADPADNTADPGKR